MNNYTGQARVFKSENGLINLTLCDVTHASWGGGTENTLMFTLPSGYRPGKTIKCAYGYYGWEITGFGNGHQWCTAPFSVNSDGTGHIYDDPSSSWKPILARGEIAFYADS